MPAKQYAGISEDIQEKKDFFVFCQGCVYIVLLHPLIEVGGRKEQMLWETLSKCTRRFINKLWPSERIRQTVFTVGRLEGFFRHLDSITMAGGRRTWGRSLAFKQLAEEWRQTGSHMAHFQHETGIIPAGLCAFYFMVNLELQKETWDQGMVRKDPSPVVWPEHLPLQLILLSSKHRI